MENACFASFTCFAKKSKRVDAVKVKQCFPQNRYHHYYHQRVASVFHGYTPQLNVFKLAWVLVHSNDFIREVGRVERTCCD